MKNRESLRGWLLLLVMISGTLLACGFSVSTDDSGVNVPRGATAINVVVNTGAAQWLQNAVADFNDAELETSDGEQVYAIVNVIEAGEGAVQLQNGSVSADLWIPDDKVWANVLADQGNGSFQSDCVSVAESPLVIGIWREVADLLGYPGRSLGWLDIGSLAADESAWAYYSGGQFGESLRLGHTHPGLSGSGASTLLAIVQSAESKSEAVTVNDIQQPIVQASVGAFEGAVSWFASDTSNLGSTMTERGISYLGAAVMYESTVLNEGQGELIPIYPFEGSFVATHPACINSSATAETQAAAEVFRSWLISEAGQQLAVANGLRPVNNNVVAGGLLSAENGVDLNQPETIFAPPSVETVYAIQDVWQSARKPIHLVMLVDTSGSMRGDKIDSMRTAAAQFVNQMGDDDYLSIVEFWTGPEVIVDYQQVGTFRQSILQDIANLEPGGDTALYDAIGMGAQVITDYNSLETTNAMIVLTDGQDTSSSNFSLDESLFAQARANDTTVFTIAYGRDADAGVLEDLAIGANGKFFQGTEASIGAIYEEMSAAFGGSVGIGR